MFNKLVSIHSVLLLKYMFVYLLKRTWKRSWTSSTSPCRGTENTIRRGEKPVCRAGDTGTKCVSGWVIFSRFLYVSVFDQGCCQMTGYWAKLILYVSLGWDGVEVHDHAKGLLYGKEHYFFARHSGLSQVGKILPSWLLEYPLRRTRFILTAPGARHTIKRFIHCSTGSPYSQNDSQIGIFFSSSETASSIYWIVDFSSLPEPEISGNLGSWVNETIHAIKLS